MRTTQFKFSQKSDSDFHKVLKQRINDFFKQQKLSKYGGFAMLFKAAVMLGLYFVPFVLFLVFVILDISILKYHVSAMLIGQCMTAFFAVWTVHHDTEDHVYMARTVRNEFKRVVTYNMFYHVEHHLFPAVPTRRLHILAKRLDEHDPTVEIRHVF